MLYTLPLALWLYILHLKPSNTLQQTHAYSVWWPVMLGTIPNIIGPSTNPKCSTKIPSNNVFCEALCPHLHCSLSLSQSWVPVLFSLEYMYSCCSTCDYAVADPGFEKGGFQSALGHYTWRRACSLRKLLDFRPSEIISGAVLGWAALCKRGGLTNEGRHHLLLWHKQMHDKRDIGESWQAYINK